MKQGWGNNWFARLLLLGMPCAVIFQYGDVMAQPLPDSSLPTNTTVSPAPGDNAFWVDGGTLAQNNLFHSFESFSVPLVGKAIFRPNPSVKTVFSRVTGKTSSLIEGLLQVEGSADFFLLNPNGVVFGPDASLDVGGSFLATTADHVEFGEGIFSATEPNSGSLLSLTTPIGLQFGQNPRGITNLARNANTAGRSPGLKVSPNQTLALIGGSITMPGGEIISPQSHIELGSLAGGSVVGIRPIEGVGLAINYDAAATYQDIQLSQLARVDSSGAGGGFTRLQGRTILVADGSQVVSNTELDQDGKGIFVKASESLEVIGTGPIDGPIDAILFDATGVKNPQRSSISANVRRFADGRGGSIQVQAPSVKVNDGGDISARVLGTGMGGDILIQASESIEVSGNAPFLGLSEELSKIAKNLRVSDELTALGIFSEELIGGAFSASFIVANSDASGPSGSIIIDTKNLLVRDGGNIAANPLEQGIGGDITITASESVGLSGVPSDEAYSPGITIGPIPFATGAPGTLTITTPRLSITGGSGIGLSTATPVGATGIFNVSEKVEIIGTSPNGVWPSSISALSAINGKGGSVKLITNDLLIANGGAITATGANASKGGDINLVANSVVIDNQSSITTSVEGRGQGIGGNVNLKIRDILLLRRNSEISAKSGKSGQGGNIFLSANFIIARTNENSDIVADAVKGKGGSIRLETNSILGLTLSDQITPSSDISASSELGIDGTVTIDTPDVALNPVEIKLSDRIEVPQLAQDCLAASSDQSNFIQTGRSGLPINPISPVAADSLWQDMEPLSYKTLPNSSITSLSDPSPASIASASTQPPLTEAQAWSLNSKGKVQLIAASSSPSLSLGSQPNCNSM